MVDNTTKSKKIAKNTLFLYIRMILLLIINLYTVRVILKNLGVEDYGIYNLIGGVVVLFSFISNSSSAATQRYLNFALGKDDYKKTQNVYSSSVLIHIVIAIIIVALSEIVGMLAINSYLTIPAERKTATQWCFQFSLITIFFNTIRIPDSAAVITHEKMSFYALLSIFEGFGKLGIAFLISIWNKDKLIFYSFLISVVNFILFFVNHIYVKRNFKICKFKFHKEKQLYKELVLFSGWSMLSSFGSTCSNQVLSMILNRFFGVIANAAIGIANQVSNAVYQLISNFQIAFEPQITKSYAAEDRNYLESLVFKTSKFSLYLLWLFILPLSLNAEIVMKVWLAEVPEYSVIFLRIILIYSLIDAITGPLWMLAYAIGNIRNYQIVAFCMSFVLIPLAWIGYTAEFPPYWIVILRVLNNLIFSSWRFGYLKKRMNFPIFKYLKSVVLPSSFVLILSFVISFIDFYLTNFNVFVQFFSSCVVSVVINVFVMYFIGCNKNERQCILQILRKSILVRKNRK